MIFRLLFLGIGLIAVNPNTELAKLRLAYFNSTCASSTSEFVITASECNIEVPICNAYKGASLAMKAAYAPGVFDKFDFFAQGKELIELAVSQDPANPEIRFIRYCIQANVPSIVFYSGDIDEDFEIIQAHLRQKNIELEFWIDAMKAMINSEKSSKEHNTWLKAKLKEVEDGRGNSCR
jgi:hypothetical protein